MDFQTHKHNRAPSYGGGNQLSHVGEAKADHNASPNFKQILYLQDKENQEQQPNKMRRVSSVNLKRNIIMIQKNMPHKKDPSHHPVTEVTNRTFQDQGKSKAVYQSHNPPGIYGAVSSSSTTLQQCNQRQSSSQQYNSYKMQPSQSQFDLLPNKHKSGREKQEPIVVDWSKKGLKHLPLIEVEGPLRLVLDFNKLRSIDNLSLASNIISLSLIGNRISSLNLISLSQSCRRLRELKVSGNRIKVIEANQSVGSLVFNSLRVLDISKNQITDQDVTNMLFQVQFKKLKVLDLSFNRLTQISIVVAVVQRLRETLRTFNCSGNAIGSPREQLVLDRQGGSKLRVLDLSGNQIASLAIYVEMRFLKQLDVSRNHLSSLNWNDDTLFPRLQELNFRCNNLGDSREIQAYLKVSPKLRVLDCGQNQFKEVVLHSKSLETLYLDSSVHHFNMTTMISQSYIPRLKCLTLPQATCISSSAALIQAFPNIIEVNGIQIDIPPLQTRDPYDASHQKFIAPIHHAQNSQPNLKTASLEFSASNYPQKGSMGIGQTLDSQVAAISSTTEEIFNSRVIRIGSSNGKQQPQHRRHASLLSQHARRSSGDFLSKRISYRSLDPQHPLQTHEYQLEPYESVHEGPDGDGHIEVFEEVVMEDYEIGPDTSRERIEDLENLQIQIQAIAQKFLHKGQNSEHISKASSQILEMFEQELEKVTNQLKRIDEENLKRTTTPQKDSDIILQRGSHAQLDPQISSFKKPQPYIDFEHLLTLLSTPLSLFILALTSKRQPGSSLIVPSTTVALLKELCQAMGLNVSSFDLGKYIFQNQEESQILDHLLAAYSSESNCHSSNKRGQTSLPAIDSYILKSNLLRCLLENEVLMMNMNHHLGGSRRQSQSHSHIDQWDIVRDLREKLLSRIQEIEDQKKTRSSLTEEYHSIAVVVPKNMAPHHSQSLQYLETTEGEELEAQITTQRQKVELLRKNGQELPFSSCSDSLKISQTRNLKVSSDSSPNENQCVTRSKSESVPTFQTLPPTINDSDLSYEQPLAQSPEIAQALSELQLYARHPLRQITVDQASITFTDDITPCSLDPQSNSFHEGKLIEYLMDSLNKGRHLLKKVMKAYNFNTIQHLLSPDDTLTLMFAKVFPTGMPQLPLLRSPASLGNQELLLSSTLLDIDDELEANCCDSSNLPIRETLVVMVPLKELPMSISHQLISEISDKYRTQQGLSNVYIPEKNLYLIQNPKVLRMMPVYHIEYTTSTQ